MITPYAGMTSSETRDSFLAISQQANESTIIKAMKKKYITIEL
jgi:hypothetical protein